MIAIGRILCPIDFSDHSRRALDHAVAVARWYGSTVTVLHVFSTAFVAAYAPGVPGFEEVALTRADRDKVLKELHRFVQAEAAPGVPVEAAIREGVAATAILEQAEEMQADLLVLGTHGRSGFEKLFLGSVADKVLRKAACPVLTVPAHVPDAVPAAPVLFTHILCPVDFSECSLHALRYATSMAQENDAELTLLHVMAYGLEASTAPVDAVLTDEGLTLSDYRQRREAAVRRQLEDAVPAGASSFCSVETALAGGEPGHEILRVARERQSDLIVIGVHGRGVMDRMLFGSTTQRVVRGATCPVLTLRHA